MQYPIPVFTQNQSSSGVKRKHAGTTRAGLPLIMPGGYKKWNDFHEQFTDKRTYKKNPYPGEVELNIKDSAKSGDIAELVHYVLPRNFCPDCDRTDRLHEAGALNMITIDEPMPGMDLRPGDVVLVCWCQECQMNDLKGTALIIPGMDDPDMDEWRKRMIRQNRMARNIQNYIQQALLAGEYSIRVPEDFRRRT